MTISEQNDALMALVPLHVHGSTVTEKVANYIEHLKRDRDAAVDRKWLDDAAREKSRVLQLAASKARELDVRTKRVAELAGILREIRNVASQPVFHTQQILDLIEEVSV